jgi:hypothetical protein
MGVLAPNERPRWECALDTRCSWFSAGLALDTSHVCVLVRAAVELARYEPAIADRFHDLLVAHACGGSHDLMTSRTLIENDRELNLASSECALRKFGDLPVGALAGVSVVDGGSGEDMPAPIGERDKTLVAAAIVASERHRGSVIVVTDDEAMADWVSSVAAGMTDLDVGILSATSIDMIDRLHDCGAVDTTVVAAIADMETQYQAQRAIPAGLLKRKLERIRRMAIAAGTRDAKRNA